MYKKAIKLFILFLIGGILYSICELIFRNSTHWTMFILGGMLFVITGLINENRLRRLGLICQGIVASLIITTFELLSGVILNIWLDLNIWDYSNIPYSFLGQINIIFSVIWFFLSIAAIILDDIIRHYLFKEPIVRYKLF